MIASDPSLPTCGFQSGVCSAGIITICLSITVVTKLALTDLKVSNLESRFLPKWLAIQFHIFQWHFLSFVSSTDLVFKNLHILLKIGNHIQHNWMDDSLKKYEKGHEFQRHFRQKQLNCYQGLKFS